MGKIGEWELTIIHDFSSSDIVDKELKALRNARWDKAFKEAPSIDDAEDIESNVNRKATSKFWTVDFFCDQIMCKHSHCSNFLFNSCD